MNETSRCSSCGEALPGSAKFCLQCGARLEPQVPPAPMEVELPQGDIEIAPATVKGPPPVLPREKEEACPPPSNPALRKGSRIGIWEAPSVTQSFASFPPPPPGVAPLKKALPETAPPPPPPIPPSAPPTAPTCPQCGREVMANAIFCRNCGVKLSMAAISAIPQTCPQCRETLPPGVSFCQACGFKVGDSVSGARLVAVPPPPPLAGVKDVPPTPLASAAAVYAGFWWRALALLIDSIPLGIVIWIFSRILFGAFIAGPSHMALAIGKVFLYYLFNVALIWWYFTALESSTWQATLGKRALGLYVTDLEGRRLSFVQAAYRNLAKYVSGLILGIGFFMAGFTQQKQALHDRMAQCLVWKRPR